VHALYNFNNCPWNERKQQVDALMAEMVVPDVRISEAAQ
jgi:hypothetical protein